MVVELVRNMALGYVHLHGQVPTHKRGDLMQQFQQDDATSIFISTDAGGTGLNLQAGSVVINMDIPWNPAVLEQRNARVHRLGQSKSVQIILMVSADSYEERVLHLVNSKQFLFDNVIGEGATEDVVGLSKQSVTTVINDLNLNSEQRESPADVTPEKVQQAGSELATELPEHPNEARSDIVDSEAGNEAEVKQLVEKLQQSFGQQIEQILVREGGLLVIVDQLSEQSDTCVEQLISSVPVALIDLKTLRMLERLGDSSPVAGAQALPDAQETPWLNRARKQLAAAQVLIERELDTGVIELLSSAAAALISAKAGRSQLLSNEEASVWIYNQEALQQLSTGEVMILAKIFSLRLSTNIPLPLLQQSLSDVEQLLL